MGTAKTIIKGKLSKKTIPEIDAIAKRLGYPLQGNKAERVHALAGYFDSSRVWGIISGRVDN